MRHLLACRLRAAVCIVCGACVRRACAGLGTVSALCHSAQRRRLRTDLEVDRAVLDPLCLVLGLLHLEDVVEELPVQLLVRVVDAELFAQAAKQSEATGAVAAARVSWGSGSCPGAGGFWTFCLLEGILPEVLEPKDVKDPDRRFKRACHRTHIHSSERAAS